MTDQELEDQVREAGNRLLEPPSSVDELLPLLDHLESCLSKVEQSPPLSMQNALLPCLKVLVSEEVMGHSDVDVKVAVASCVSEVTRITAPDAPYEDEKMKEIFKVIVAAFEKLCDTSSRSYSKRVSILETVAKVRSCVVMLDLECDALILKMFEHFLKSIRDFHEDTVYSSMETIMTLVLEESEDIDPTLLSVLLDSVKKDNKDVLPIARRLAEKVLSNCAAKLKPYLMQSLNSMGLSLDDYTGTVASICQETPDSVQPSDGNGSGEHLVDENKVPVKADPEKPLKVVKELEPQSACSTHESDPIVKNSPKSIMSNGNAQTENDDSLVGVDSSKVKAELSDPVIQSAEGEPSSADTKLVKSETKSDQATKKKRGRKPNSSKQTAEASGHSNVDSEKETLDLPDGKKDHGKVVSSSLAEDQSAIEATTHSGSEKESLLQGNSSNISRDQSGKVSSPSPSQSTPDETRPKRGRPARTKKGNVDEDTDSGLPSVVEVAESDEQIEAGEPKSADFISKEQGGNSEMESKAHQRSGKKALSRNSSDGLVSPHTDIAKKDSGATSDPETKPSKRSGKKVDAIESNENESGKKEGKAKRGRGATTSEKDESEDTIVKKKLCSPKSISKLIDKNQSHLEETPKTGSKRKRTSGKKEHSVEGLDESLVGSKIKVWWPRDKTFYEGVVDSFDPAKKKHKVLYVDGDTEELVLRKEKWERIEKTEDEKEATDLPSPDASEMSRKRKAKMSSDSPAKQTKSDTKGKGASSGKSKDESSSKSGGKSKDDGKVGSKSTEDTPKTSSKSKSDSAGKSKDNNPKSNSKSKDNSSKSGAKSKEGAKSIKDDTTKAGGSKSKDDKAKVGSNSKSETPKAGSKSKANGSSAKGKSGESKNVQESDEPTRGSAKSGKREYEESTKGKVSDSGETKSGKKRRKMSG